VGEKGGGRVWGVGCGVWGVGIMNYELGIGENK